MLDYRLAEMAAHCPEEFKISPAGKTKFILRQEAQDIFGPEISERPKQGFSIPVHRWLRGKARPLAEELLSRRELDEMGLLRTEAVLRVKELHMTGKAQLGFELWGLMVLAAWHRARVRHARPAPHAELRRVTFSIDRERAQVS